MRWGSLDNFIIQDDFWQDKMGKPIVNKDFLVSILKYGTFDSYNFFCLDSNNLVRLQTVIEELVPADLHDRITLSLQALISETLKSNPVDIMHQGDFTYHMPQLIDFRNRRNGEPPFAVSGLTHSLDSAQLHARFLHLLLARPRPYDAVVCTSSCARRLLEKAFDMIGNSFQATYGADLGQPPSLVDIPLAITDDFERPVDRGESRRALELPDDGLVLLCLGRLSVRQKMDLAPMLECIQWLADGDKLPPFTFILGGGGDAANVALVEQMISELGLEEIVRLEPNVSFERKRQLYAAADVFLSLVDNYQETFGLTVVEAMSHGLPVVVSDFSGYREIVDDGGTGFLVPTYASASTEPWETVAGLLDPSVLRFYRAQKVAFDLSALAEIVARLANDDGLRREMGEKARARSEDFRWRRIIPQYEAVWREQRQKIDHERRNGVATAPAGAPSTLAPKASVLFSHYPTKVLDGGRKLRLTDYGRWRHRRSLKQIFYSEAAALLDQTWLQALVNILEDGPLTFGALVDGARSAFDATDEVAIFHLDWLLKHGILAVEEAVD